MQTNVGKIRDVRGGGGLFPWGSRKFRAPATWSVTWGLHNACFPLTTRLLFFKLPACFPLNYPTIHTHTHTHTHTLSLSLSLSLLAPNNSTTNNTIIHNFPLHKAFFRNPLATDLGFHCHILDAKFICVFMIHLRHKFKTLREFMSFVLA